MDPSTQSHTDKYVKIHRHTPALRHTNHVVVNLANCHGICRVERLMRDTVSGSMAMAKEASERVRLSDGRKSSSRRRGTQVHSILLAYCPHSRTPWV